MRAPLIDRLPNAGPRLNESVRSEAKAAVLSVAPRSAVTARLDASFSATVITHSDDDQDGDDCCHAYAKCKVGGPVRGVKNGKRNR